MSNRSSIDREIEFDQQMMEDRLYRSDLNLFLKVIETIQINQRIIHLVRNPI
jgi:hypothetical protein